MRLDRSHYEDVKKLLYSNQERTINGYQFAKGLAWIQQSFLGQEPGHYIFGSFHEGELVSIASLIIGFPFHKTAYVGNVFYKPKFPLERVKVQASEEAYRVAVETGATKVISCVLEERYQSQWNLVSRYSKYVRENFDTHLARRIEAGVYPPEPWLQFILGFKAPAKTCVIREAILKNPSEQAS